MRKEYKIYRKTDPLLPIEGTPLMGKSYHVSWSRSHGIIGVVNGIDYIDKKVIMINPKTKKQWEFPVKWTELRYTRADQTKIESNKILYHASN